MSESYWGVSMIGKDDTLTIAIRFGNTDFGDMLDRRIALLTVSRNGKLLHSSEAKGFRTSSNNLNSLSASLINGSLTISGGGEYGRQLAEIDLSEPFSPEGMDVWSVGQLLVTAFSTETCRQPSIALDSGWNPEGLNQRFLESDDPIEGYWAYFDRNNDPSYAHIGGNYTLAVVRDESAESGEKHGKSYKIIYISGATTLADKWIPMMTKGSLGSTIFQGHYDLEWVDSTFERITTDAHATLESDDCLLTLSFPLLKSTIRFSKQPLGHMAK